MLYIDDATRALLKRGRIFTVIIKTTTISTWFLLEKTILSGLLSQLKAILDDIDYSQISKNGTCVTWNLFEQNSIFTPIHL